MENIELTSDEKSELNEYWKIVLEQEYDEGSSYEFELEGTLDNEGELFFEDDEFEWSES